MTEKTTAVHVTHETVNKVGGIGAVLQGFFTSQTYLDKVERSILVGPLFTTEGFVHGRLGENGEVLYSSIDGFVNTAYAHAFHQIENHYGTGIIYGTRTFVDEETGVKSSPEVILIDVRHIDKGAINHFKARLFEEFDIRSDRYEHLWEFEQYVRLAPVAIEVLKAINAADDSTLIVAHEFMGMPTALAGILDIEHNFQTLFYAHEVATMRHIVEKHPGHDTMFYNTIRRAHNEGLHLDEVFGEQDFYFKHSLVKASRYCDLILAVGDYVVDELRFLAPEFETANIDIVYNGIPAYQISAAEKLASKAKLQRYCENLLGHRPDFVFTHVTRLVRSKGMWRDLRVLEQIEKEFRAQNKTAVLFVLSTEVAQRRSQEIFDMEATYKWPVAHREGWPDLSGGEAEYYTAVQEFNARSRNIKIVFINQFGFEARHCGSRMPENIEFMDIRKGTDVEFGQSIYEPFGIAQVEPLTFGGICVFSSVCGCLGFVNDITGGEDVQNVIVADYTKLEGQVDSDIEDLLLIDRASRDHIEESQSEKVGMQICSRLPKNEAELEGMIESGYNLAKNMSWDVVVRNYLIESLEKIPPQMGISLN